MATLANIQNILDPDIFTILERQYSDDLRPLQDGVLYQHKGKVWLIRLGIPDDQVRDPENITRVFFLVHSTRKTYLFRSSIKDGKIVHDCTGFGKDSIHDPNDHGIFFYNILKSQRCDLTQMAPKIPHNLEENLRSFFLKTSIPLSLLRITPMEIPMDESGVDEFGRSKQADPDPQPDYASQFRGSDISDNDIDGISSSTNNGDGISTSIKIGLIFLALVVGGYATYKIVQYVRSPRKIGV